MWDVCVCVGKKNRYILVPYRCEVKNVKLAHWHHLLLSENE